MSLMATFFILLALLATPASTFFVATAPQLSHMVMASSKSDRFVPQSTFERAVECSKKLGYCDVDELWKLSDELEAFQEFECFYEDEHESWLCDKEASDRLDLADMLKMDAEMQLRRDYLKKANLFVGDVEEAHNMKERSHLIDLMDREVFADD